MSVKCVFWFYVLTNMLGDANVYCDWNTEEQASLASTTCVRIIGTPVLVIPYSTNAVSCWSPCGTRLAVTDDSGRCLTVYHIPPTAGAPVTHLCGGLSPSQPLGARPVRVWWDERLGGGHVAVMFGKLEPLQGFGLGVQIVDTQNKLPSTRSGTTPYWYIVKYSTDLKFDPYKEERTHCGNSSVYETQISNGTLYVYHHTNTKIRYAAWRLCELRRCTKHSSSVTIDEASDAAYLSLYGPAEYRQSFDALHREFRLMLATTPDPRPSSKRNGSTRQYHHVTLGTLITLLFSVACWFVMQRPDHL